MPTHDGMGPWAADYRSNSSKLCRMSPGSSTGIRVAYKQTARPWAHVHGAAPAPAARGATG